MELVSADDYERTLHACLSERLTNRMNEKELRKLSREDLLEMLVSQTREVERLQEEKNILISQLGSLKDGFKKAGALEFAMGQLGFPISNANSGSYAAAIDEVIARHV